MKKLLSLFLLPLALFGADAANDLILTQRKADNSGNIQRNVAPVASGFLTFDASKVPTSPAGLTWVTPTLTGPDAFSLASPSYIAMRPTTYFISTAALNSINTLATITPFTELEVDSTSTSSPRGIMSAQFNTGTEGGQISMRKARGTRASPTIIVTDDKLGRIVASGWDGSSYLDMATILFVAEGTVASTRIPTKIVFQTATDAAPSVLTTRLTIDSAGLSSFVGNMKVTAASGDAINIAKAGGTPGFSFGDGSTNYGLIESINGGGLRFYTGSGTQTSRFNISTTAATFQSTVTMAVQNATEATTGGAGSLTTAGGIYAAKKIFSATNILSTGATSGIGYATGAGGTVTQNTDRTTAVTLDKICGAITTNTASLSPGSAATFTVNNSAVAITDTVNVCIRSGQDQIDTRVNVTRVAAGAFDITVYNTNGGGNETGAIIINFAVIKAVSS